MIKQHIDFIISDISISKLKGINNQIDIDGWYEDSVPFLVVFPQGTRDTKSGTKGKYLIQPFTIEDLLAELKR